jgi:hypothetical protein
MGRQPRHLWRRSSLCTSGECVEVALDRKQVHVRDSVGAPTGTVLDFTRHQWDSFVLGVKSHEFDWPSSSIEPSGQQTRRLRGPSASEPMGVSYNE